MAEPLLFQGSFRRLFEEERDLGEVFVHRGSSGTSGSEAQSLPRDGVC